VVETGARACRPVLIDKDKGGAVDDARDVQPRTDALCQAGLSSPQLALKADDIASPQQLPETLADGMRLSGTVRNGVKVIRG